MEHGSGNVGAGTKLITRNFWRGKSGQRGVGDVGERSTQGEKIKIYFYFKGRGEGSGGRVGSERSCWSN